MSFIYYAQTSYPDYEYEQVEIKELIIRLWPNKKEIIHQFFESTNVKKRHLALPLSHYLDLGHFGVRNNAWKKEAVKLQKKNVQEILQKVSISVDDIKLVASVNSTGVCVPSLEALLMNHLPLNYDTKRLPLFGLGCLGGVAGINRVNDYLQGESKASALCLVTELCSLTYQLNDSSTANLVGTALFGDGAGAVLMVGKQHPLASSAALEILHTKSFFYPDTEHYMGWKMVASGFEIELSNEIPHLVRHIIGKDVQKFISDCKKEQSDIRFFIAHPGGPKVLDSFVESMGKAREDIELSWESLQEHGNVSSVSVINVLEKTLKRKDIKKGDLGLMLAMGPAFSLEISLVQKC